MRNDESDVGGSVARPVHLQLSGGSAGSVLCQAGWLSWVSISCLSEDGGGDALKTRGLVASSYTEIVAGAVIQVVHIVSVGILVRARCVV